MTLAAATRSDWKYWPERENVTYRVVAPLGTYTPTSLSATGGAAKKRALRFTELASSNGVYTSQDRNWLIPDEILSAVSLSPKPGDQVRDSGSIDWTVLSVDRGKYGNTWKLTCRALALVYGLRSTGTLYRPSNDVDDAGKRNPNLSTVSSSLACRVQPVTGQVADDGYDGRVMRGQFMAYLSDRVIPKYGDIFEADGKRYTVTGWDSPDSLGNLMSFTLDDLAEVL